MHTDKPAAAEQHHASSSLPHPSRHPHDTDSIKFTATERRHATTLHPHNHAKSVPEHEAVPDVHPSLDLTIAEMPRRTVELSPDQSPAARHLSHCRPHPTAVGAEQHAPTSRSSNASRQAAALDAELAVHVRSLSLGAQCDSPSSPTQCPIVDASEDLNLTGLPDQDPPACTHGLGDSTMAETGPLLSTDKYHMATTACPLVSTHVDDMSTMGAGMGVHDNDAMADADEVQRACTVHCISSSSGGRQSPGAAQQVPVIVPRVTHLPVIHLPVKPLLTPSSNELILSVHATAAPVLTDCGYAAPAAAFFVASPRLLLHQLLLLLLMLVMLVPLPLLLLGSVLLPLLLTLPVLM